MGILLKMISIMQNREGLQGFQTDWLGEFYAYYQWYYKCTERRSDFQSAIKVLRKAYYGLHDLELDLAVKKVGAAS